MVFKLLLLLALAAPAGAAEDLLEHPYWNLPASTAAVTPAAPGLVNGETLEYDIYWGLVYVGRAYLKIEQTVDISSRPALHIVSEARSGSFINSRCCCASTANSRPPSTPRACSTAGGCTRKAERANRAGGAAAPRPQRSQPLCLM